MIEAAWITIVKMANSAIWTEISVQWRKYTSLNCFQMWYKIKDSGVNKCEIFYENELYDNKGGDLYQAKFAQS
jgi:hypothetical protein